MRTAGIVAPRARINRTIGRRQAAMAMAALAALVGSLLLALCASAASRLPWQELRLHLAARAWPQVEGAVRSVSLSERSHLGARQDGPARELVLAVAYEYEVDGVPHEGLTASFSDTGAPHDRRLMALYTRLNFALVTGRPVPVFYDPAAPERAVLDTGFESGKMLLDAAPAALGGLLGLWLLLSPLRGRRIAAPR